MEFKLTGITPEPWTAETVVLREPAFGDAANELRLAMSVARLGVKEANRRAAPDPWDDLTVPEGLDVTLITDEVLAATRTGGPLPRLKAVTVKDFYWAREGGAWKPVPCPLGEGMVNWSEFFSALAKARYAGPVTIEMKYQPKDELNAIRKDLEFVRKHLAM